MSIAFVFTNPGHHLEMMDPVVDELRRRRLDASLISLAEFRGLITPSRLPPIARAIPFQLRRRPGQMGVGVEFREWQRGSHAKRLAWSVGLAPRLAWLLRKSRVIVVPNDAVFPYIELLELSSRIGIRRVLMQEGIRYALPQDRPGFRYGVGKVDAACVWGEGSREYFAGIGANPDRMFVTGAPRMDSVAPSDWTARGGELLGSLSLAKRPVVFVSNPIEIQGYGDKALRLACFERLVEAIVPLLAERGLSLLVKTHAYEDPVDYALLARRSPQPGAIHILEKTVPLFQVLAAASAAIVLSSTVGLEALVFGVPLGVLEIPGYGFAFEYVERGAAVPLPAADLHRGLQNLLDRPAKQGIPFVQRHLHEHGRAYRHVADVVEKIAR